MARDQPPADLMALGLAPQHSLEDADGRQAGLGNPGLLLEQEAVT